ncbi:MAG: putative ABC transporter permease [Christensenellales bacterium]
MSKLKKMLTVFATGALGYSAIELIWRGRTHPTMAFTGGICFSVLYVLNARLKKTRLLRKCLLGAILITGLELAVGCVLNKRLNMGIWDYSEQPFNFRGQICPLYSVLWFGLCIPVSLISKRLSKKMH